MGGDVKAFIANLLKESRNADFTVDNTVDIVEGDVLATINGVDYAIVIEEI